MKDFENFRASVNQKLIDQWCEEAHEQVIGKIGEQTYENDAKWVDAYNRSFNFAIMMRLLEHYHKWLSE